MRNQQKTVQQASRTSENGTVSEALDATLTHLPQELQKTSLKYSEKSYGL
jgi:hypothetical protein